MCEASSRMGEHVGWRAVAESALQLFTCSRLFLHGKRRLFDREVESPNPRARSNAQRREAQSLLRVCPYMRMSAGDWRGLARIFARGRGWIWDDRAVQTLREAFDEQLLRHLWSLRHDLVARCIVTQNLRYEVTVPLVAATSTACASSGAAEAASRMHNVTSRISARFVRWIVHQLALLQNAKASSKSCAAVADLCCRFLFSLECPKTFDSFAGLLMKEEEA